ncbi:hypothetical protein PP707_04140 [Acetobacter pasteurianus]|nr:hypothetical protein [Acetobacter pasteurianus]
MERRGTFVTEWGNEKNRKKRKIEEVQWWGGGGAGAENWEMGREEGIGCRKMIKVKVLAIC